MSLKKFLIIPLLVSLAVFIHYSTAVHGSFDSLRQQVHITPSLIITIVLAIGLQLAGHIVRAHKAEYLFRPIKANTTRFQFRALSIGYLFDALLPLRLGELIRARVLAGGMDLSFSFALSLVVVERAFDAAILALTGLLILLTFHVSTSAMFPYIVAMFIGVGVIASGALIIIKQNRHLFHWIYSSSALFRDTIKHSLRFKVWSVIYGLQRCLRPNYLVRYIGLSLLSWAFYGASLLVLAQHLLPHIGLRDKLLAAVAPYYGVSIPAGPANLGIFSHVTNTFTAPLHLTADSRLVFNLLAWAVLIIPIAVIGVILFFIKTRETLWRKAPRRVSAGSLENKLYRTEDISQEMSRFLENYFSGNTLSHIVHELELHDDFRLLKYFKGGSDAITILARQDGREIVKKIIPPEFKDRLKAQYEWLQSHQVSGIVRVLGEEEATNYYAINLEYRAGDQMLFDFMHQNPMPSSTKVLDEVWGYLFKHVYGKPARLTLHTKERDAYIKKHIFDCLEKAAKVDTELLRATESAKIVINGRTYDNLYQIMDKIKRHPKAWQDLARYRATKSVHGDVAVDNILVATTGCALLIDPAPDGNIMNGPVFDFGKNMQSLYCGYEFLLRDEDPVYLIGGSTINYRSHSSAQYIELCEYIRTKLAPRYLSRSEQRAIVFHAAALHIRRLKHQVYYNPANVLKFYAVGVKTLNEFLAQYD